MGREDKDQPSPEQNSAQDEPTESAALQHGIPPHPDAHRFEGRGGSREPTPEDPKE
jgi:hypothetical protein